MNITPEKLKVAESIFSSISECIKGTSLEHLLHKEIDVSEDLSNGLAGNKENDVAGPDFIEDFKMH